MISFKNQKLLVIAPHPDDEVLGCGGFIKRIKDEGGKVYVLFLTVGHTKEYSKKGLSTTKERLGEIERVAKFLKYDDYHISFPGNQFHLRLDNIPQKDLIEEIENTKVSLNKTKPTIVAFPSIHHYNQDHRVAAHASFSATRPMPDELKPLQRLVLSFEESTDMWSSNSAEPLNFYVGLTPDQLKAKITALKLYKSQVRSGHHARSPKVVESLAHIRGSQCGYPMAEAFFCYRHLI